MSDNPQNLQNNNQNKGWFYKLGMQLTKEGFNSLIFISILISVGTIFFEPACWFGSAALCLYLLRLNVSKMIQAVLLVSLISFGLIYFNHTLIGSAFRVDFSLMSLLIQSIIPAIVIALSYKLSQSLSLTLIFLLDLIFILALISIPFYDEVLNAIKQILSQIFNNTPMGNLLFNEDTIADETIQNWSKNTLSILFASLFIQYIIIAFISKKWLNQMNNQFLSFSDELVKLRAYDWMGLVMIAILLLSYWFNEITFFKIIFFSYISYFFVLGLSLMHQFFRKRKLSTSVIILGYALVVVFGQISIIALSTIATARCIKNFFINTKSN